MARNLADDEEREMAKAESVSVMRVVGGRCIDAEKLAWALEYLMRKRPGEQAALRVLAEELQDYLSSSASMVKKVIHDRLSIDIAEMNEEK